MSQCTLISVADAERMIRDMPVLVLDMRDFKSYQAGHFPKSIHLNDLTLRQLIKHTAKQVPILIYCEHGHRSQDMVQIFSTSGFSNCFSLEGGFDNWFQTVRAPKAPLSKTLCLWLAQNGFDVHNLNKRTWNNETALISSARQGNYDICAELLDAGAAVDAMNRDGNNALWMACINESYSIVDLLIEYDINIDNQNDNGATALIYAASVGNVRLVDTLIAAGANIHLATLDDFNALSVAANVATLSYLRSFCMPLARTG
ncbi:MAG: ankyrin repeat domain-containing protein [Marinagarivorans sp.]